MTCRWEGTIPQREDGADKQRPRDSFEEEKRAAVKRLSHTLRTTQKVACEPDRF